MIFFFSFLTCITHIYLLSFVYHYIQLAPLPYVAFASDTQYQVAPMNFLIIWLQYFLIMGESETYLSTFPFFLWLEFLDIPG